jgi:hypothetical protein
MKEAVTGVRIFLDSVFSPITGYKSIRGYELIPEHFVTPPGPSGDSEPP